MALDFGQRRALWAVLAVFVGLTVLFIQVRGCLSGQRLAGEAKGSIESMEEIPIDVVLEMPGLDERLSSLEPPLTVSKFINLGCALIVDDNVQHLVDTDDPDCPSVVLPEVAGFDLVISYTDASCRWEPTFEVNRAEGLLQFTINKTRDRGGCDDIGLLLAKGIQLKKQIGGSG